MLLRKTIIVILSFLMTLQLHAQSKNELFWKAAKSNDTTALKKMINEGIANLYFNLHLNNISFRKVEVEI